MVYVTAMIGIGIVLGAATAAYADSPLVDPPSGMELQNDCKASETACLSYLIGYFRGYFTGQQVATQLEVIVCPQAVGAPQARLIVQEAMRDQPELLPERADVIVAKAIMDFFKCKPGETPKYWQKPN